MTTATNGSCALPAMLAMTATMLLVQPASATDITGSGSTFVYPVMLRWAGGYHAKTRVKVNYQAIGSGGGIRQVKDGLVAFGATDKPLPPDELQSADLLQFPLVIGGVVPVVHLDGVAPGGLKLTGELLADIFLGKVANWNDPAIAALNPDVALPDLRITVMHRIDASGTTFNFVNYLSKVSEEWKSKVGEGTMVKWPAGPHFFQLLTDAPGEKSWPITATTFALMPRAPKDAAQTAEALRFFKWSLEQGKADARSLHYVPLPDGLIQRIEAYWDQGGK